HRLHLGDRRVWCVLHPQELWVIDRRNGWPRAGIVRLPCLLRQLHRLDLVVLYAPRRATVRQRAPSATGRCTRRVSCEVTCGRAEGDISSPSTFFDCTHGGAGSA